MVAITLVNEAMSKMVSTVMGSGGFGRAISESFSIDYAPLWPTSKPRRGHSFVDRIFQHGVQRRKTGSARWPSQQVAPAAQQLSGYEQAAIENESDMSRARADQLIRRLKFAFLSRI